MDTLAALLKTVNEHLHTNPDKASEIIEQYLDENPDLPETEQTIELQALYGMAKLLSGHTTEGMPILDEVMPILEQRHMVNTLLNCHTAISNTHWKNNNIKGMLRHCLITDEIVARNGDESLCISRYQNIGFAYMEMGDHDRAQAYFERSIALNRKLGNHKALIQTYNKMASNFVKQEKYKKALEFFFIAWRMCTEHKQDMLKGRILMNIGTCYRMLLDYDKAFDYFTRSQDELEKIGDKQMLATLYINLGIIYHKTNDNANALKTYFKALKLHTELNMLWQRNSLYNNIANIYFALNNTKKAMKYYLKALETTNREDNPEMSALLMVNIGSCERRNGNYSTAAEYIKRGIEVFKEHKMKSHLGEAYRNLAFNSAENGDYEEAYDYLLECVRYYERVYDFSSREDIDKIKEQYDILSSEYENLQEKFELLNQDLEKLVGHQLIGKSRQIREVHNLAMKAAMHPNVNVLIYGESGVGKEIIARIIHHASIRKNAYFSAINSSAINDTLFESEFFGHVKGAFTNAEYSRKGYIQQAHQGTLFLDEITEMPLDFQTKLLRAIEEKKIIPVGDSKTIEVDFRVIASTNRDVHKMVQDDLFRYDLLHRLNTIEIYIPPLRERQEDIIVLMWHFIELIGKRMNRKPVNITEGFIERFRSYHFPGNVRELKNLIERAIILADDRILNESIARKILSTKEEAAPVVHTESVRTLNLEENEKQLVLMALKRSDWNQKKAADLLGVSQNAIYRKMKKYNLK